VRGLAYIVSDGKAIGICDEGFFGLGISSLLSIPTPVWIMTICFAVFGILLNQTVFGRNTLAIGGNPEAAHLAGIRVARTKLVIFVMQGLMSGFAGIILAARMTSGQPNAAQGLELQVISACVLGGVSLTGGVATITGVVVGVLIMGMVQNAMNLLNIPPFYQYVASGMILLAAVLFDRFKQDRSE
jgi:L-arabinose transport system permease protein